MPASDFLKEARDDGYPTVKPPQKADSTGDDNDPDESPTTSRIIKLSDDEQKAFSNAKPGQELECVVRGNLEEDGHFHVMSVSPPGGASSYGESQMADQVAQRVMPGMPMGQ